MMRWLVRVVSVLVVVPLMAFLLLYFSRFYPHISELKTIIASQEKVVSKVSDIHRLALLFEGHQGIRNYATRLAYRELVFDKESIKTSTWHVDTALWYFSSYFHFNENEMFYLWSSLVYIQKKGLQRSSLYLFSKELSELSLRQKAELIAMVKAPHRFKLGSVALKKRVDRILGLTKIQGQ